MGTHPIFESDFDCLTEIGGDVLVRWSAATVVAVPAQGRDLLRKVHAVQGPIEREI